MLSRRLILAVTLSVGAVLVLAGLLVLALPVSAQYKDTTVQCGSGFQGVSRDADLMDTGGQIVSGPRFGTPRVDACHSAITTQRVIGWPMVGVGGLVLVAGLVMCVAWNLEPRSHQVAPALTARPEARG
jgi:hypothetical protein